MLSWNLEFGVQTVVLVVPQTEKSKILTYITSKCDIFTVEKPQFLLMLCDNAKREIV